MAALVLDQAPNIAPVALSTAAEFAALQNAAGPVTACGFGWGWPEGQPELLSNGIKRSVDVPVTAGLSADGFVAVEPVDAARLSVGDRVVVGR